MARKKTTLDLSRFSNLCRQDMANILGIAPAAIRGYVERGAPQNENVTYNLSAFVNHIITKRRRGSEGENPDLDRQIKEEQLRKLELQNDENEGNLVPKAAVEQTLSSRALSMVSFFQRALLENVYQMEMKKAIELHPILQEITIQAVDFYRGKTKGED